MYVLLTFAKMAPVEFFSTSTKSVFRTLVWNIFGSSIEAEASSNWVNKLVSVQKRL